MPSNTTPREVRMQHLSWVDYHARLATGAVVLVPVGALEQHGPHLPLGTDAMLATAVAVGVAERVAGLVAAPFNYGYKSQARCGGGQCFPGTTSLDAATLTALAVDVLRELVRHGARRVVLLDGHYENQWFLIEACELAVREHRGLAEPLRLMRTEYWDHCTADILDPMFPGGFPGFALEHAAVIETSLMLHCHPELVDLSAIPDDPPAAFPVYDLYPQDGTGVPPSGVLSSARAADADKGRIIFDAVCHGVAQSIVTAWPEVAGAGAQRSA